MWSCGTRHRGGRQGAAGHLDHIVNARCHDDPEGQAGTGERKPQGQQSRGPSPVDVPQLMRRGHRSGFVHFLLLLHAFGAHVGNMRAALLRCCTHVLPSCTRARTGILFTRGPVSSYPDNQLGLKNTYLSLNNSQAGRSHGPPVRHRHQFHPQNTQIPPTLTIVRPLLAPRRLRPADRVRSAQHGPIYFQSTASSHGVG